MRDVWPAVDGDSTRSRGRVRELGRGRQRTSRRSLEATAPLCALLNSALLARSSNLKSMNLNNVKRTLAGAYVIGIGGVAVASGVTSAAGLVAFAALAVLPAAALLVLWQDPPPSMSETIQNQTAHR